MGCLVSTHTHFITKWKKDKEEEEVLVYKIDILKKLKEAGYNTSMIRKEKLLSESTIQQIRRGEVVGIKSIDKLCGLLDMQPSEILEYRKDNQK